ncbi:hypothetical protein ALMA_1006 [Alloscardovia macacae]|uniref:Uncharacterized protein n=1 Tax=Alloscardovia macacae TaxID=1160091 RepID=A0A261F4K6_9BIFI|nr:hypothetical protein ALMA_1006 [Alloscardovia macacae]
MVMDDEKGMVMKNFTCAGKDPKCRNILFQVISWGLSALFIFLSSILVIACPIKGEALRFIVSFGVPIVVLVAYTLKSFIIYYRNEWGKKCNNFLFVRGMACSALWIFFTFLFCWCSVKGFYTSSQVSAIRDILEIISIILIIAFSLIWVSRTISITLIRGICVFIFGLCLLSIGNWAAYTAVAAAITYLMENIKPVAFRVYGITLQDDEHNNGIIKSSIVVLHAFTCIVILTLVITDWIHDVLHLSFFSPFLLSHTDMQGPFYLIIRMLSDRAIVFAIISLLGCLFYRYIKNKRVICRIFNTVTEEN